MIQALGMGLRLWRGTAVLRNLHFWGVKYGPLIGPLRPFRGTLGTLRGTDSVWSRYIKTPDLRAHARGAWFQPSIIQGKTTI